MDGLDEIINLRIKNVDELSKNTKRAMATHLKIFKHNNVPIDKEHLVFNMKSTLDRLINIKGEPISDAYKCAMIVTIKRLFPDAKVSTKEYRKKQNRQTEELTEVINIGTKIINYIAQSLAENPQFQDGLLYDTYLAILFMAYTGLRISEVYQIQYPTLSAILAEEKVQIKTKTNDTGVYVPMSAHLASLINLIIENRDYYASQETTFRDRLKKKRIDQGYVILSSESQLYIKLKMIVSQFDDSNRVTFNTFRKCSTSALMNRNYISEAQAFNRHTTVETTSRFYTAANAEDIDNVF